MTDRPIRIAVIDGIRCEVDDCTPEPVVERAPAGRWPALAVGERQRESHVLDVQRPGAIAPPGLTSVEGPAVQRMAPVKRRVVVKASEAGDGEPRWWARDAERGRVNLDRAILHTAPMEEFAEGDHDRSWASHAIVERDGMDALLEDVIASGPLVSPDEMALTLGKVRRLLATVASARTVDEIMSDIWSRVGPKP